MVNRNVFILGFVIVVLIIGVVYLYASKQFCPTCIEQSSCPQLLIYKLDSYTKASELRSLSDNYTLSFSPIDRKSLELKFVDAVNKRITTIWTVDLKKPAKYITGNMQGQFVVLSDNDEEIYAFPPTPPFSLFSSYLPFFIFISDSGDLIARRYIDSSDVLWTKSK